MVLKGNSRLCEFFWDFRKCPGALINWLNPTAGLVCNCFKMSRGLFANPFSLSPLHCGNGTGAMPDCRPSCTCRRGLWAFRRGPRRPPAPSTCSPPFPSLSLLFGLGNPRSGRSRRGRRRAPRRIRPPRGKPSPPFAPPRRATPPRRRNRAREPEIEPSPSPSSSWPDSRPARLPPPQVFPASAVQPYATLVSSRPSRTVSSPSSPSASSFPCRAAAGRPPAEQSITRSSPSVPPLRLRTYASLRLHAAHALRPPGSAYRRRFLVGVAAGGHLTRAPRARPGRRPEPASRPVVSDARPALTPAWAGHEAGLFGQDPGLRPGLGRL